MSGRILAVTRLFCRRSTLLCFFSGVAAASGCSGGSSDSTKPQSADQKETGSATIGATGGTVTTPSGAIGIQVPAGTFSQPTTVTITQLTAPNDPGKGPLPTNLAQYGPYYEIATSPANAVIGDSVRIGLCQVTDPSSPYYAPEKEHERLRLAHTVNGQVEILDPVGVSDFLRCQNVTARHSTPKTLLGRMFASVSNRAEAMLGVTPAYASHVGIGARVKSFSPFAAVVDACNTPYRTQVGTANVSVSGKFNGADCNLGDDQPVVLASGTTNGTTIVQFRLTQGGGSATLGILPLTKPLDRNKLIVELGMGRLDYVILPPGTFAMLLQSGKRGSTDDYLFFGTLQSNLDGCTGGGTSTGAQTYLAVGIDYNGAFTSNDCQGSQTGVYVDHMNGWFVAGQKYQFLFTGPINSTISLCRPTGNSGCSPAGYPSAQATAANPTATLNYNPTTTEELIVNVVNGALSQTGSYRLRFNRL